MPSKNWSPGFQHFFNPVLDPALDPVLDLALDPALNPASDPLLDRLLDLRWHLLEALYVFFFPPFTNFNEL